MLPNLCLIGMVICRVAIVLLYDQKFLSCMRQSRMEKTNKTFFLSPRRQEENNVISCVRPCGTATHVRFNSMHLPLSGKPVFSNIFQFS